MIRRRAKEKHDGAVPISSLFAKYQARLRPPQGVVITAFCAAVEHITKHALARDCVRYNVHTKTVSVSTSGPHKSEILFNKKQILTLCKETLGGNGTPEHIV
jgi:hypothetical protein